MQEAVTALEVVSRVTMILALTLASALLIERLLEILKAGVDLLDSRYDWHRFWTRRAEGTQRFMERRMRVFSYVDPRQAAVFLERFSDMLLAPADGYTGTVPMLSGDLVRAMWVRIGSKLVGMTVGIGLAFWFGIDLFYLSRGCPPDPPPAAAAAGCAHTAWQFILSGMAIGLGCGPVHKVIRRLERRREAQLARAGANAA
jgi:hypothetical protein